MVLHLYNTQDRTEQLMAVQMRLRKLLGISRHDQIRSDVDSKYIGKHTHLPDMDEKHNYRLPKKMNCEPTSHCPLGRPGARYTCSLRMYQQAHTVGRGRRRSRRRKILNEGYFFWNSEKFNIKTTLMNIIWLCILLILPFCIPYNDTVKKRS